MGEEAIQKSKLRNYLLTIVIGFGNSWFGYAVGILNPLGEQMLIRLYDYDAGEDKDSKTKRDTTLSLLNTMFSIGALVGVLLAGPLADRFGRRAVNYGTDVLAIV